MTRRAIIVTASALIAADGRVLVARRPPGKAHAGLWEFPGGKVEAGEPVLAALARELAEELGIAIDAASAVPLGFAVDGDAAREVTMLLFAVTRWRGTPVAIEHDALAWREPSALAGLPMPPLDVALLPALDAWLASPAAMEARAGIEPACKDLQSSA